MESFGQIAEKARRESGKARLILRLTTIFFFFFFRPLGRDVQYLRILALVICPSCQHSFPGLTFSRIFGEAFCVFRTVVLEIVTSASILTVLCFTVERYLAICFPIISQKVLGGLSRALKMIMIVWFLSFLLAVPYTFTAGVFVSVTNEIRNQTVQILDSRICAIRPDYWEPMLYYMAVTTFLVFVIPIFVITVLYILMGITLYKASRRPPTDQRYKPNGMKSEQMLLHQNDEHRPWSRQHTISTVKSRPTRNSRRAVLKMLGELSDLPPSFFISVISSGRGHCLFHLLGSISHPTDHCLCHSSTW